MKGHDFEIASGIANAIADHSCSEDTASNLRTSHRQWTKKHPMNFIMSLSSTKIYEIAFLDDTDAAPYHRRFPTVVTLSFPLEERALHHDYENEQILLILFHI